MSKHRSGGRPDQPDDIYVIPAQTEEPESDVPEGLIVIGVIGFGTLVICALTIMMAKLVGIF